MIGNIRKIEIIFSIFILLAMSPAIAREIKNSNVQTSQSIEERFLQKITDDINLFLSEKSYRIFANAQLKNFREKVVLEGELENDSSEQDIQKKSATLPGFEQIESKPDQASKIKRKEKSRFIFKDRSEIISVSVRLILDKSLDSSKKQLAIITTQEMIDIMFGDKGTLNTIELALEPQLSYDSPWEWVLGYVNRRAGSAIDLFYIFLLLMLFIAAILGLRFYFKRRSQEDTHVPPSSPMDTGNEKKQNAQLINKKLDKIVDILNQSPLITRIFLQSLKTEDKLNFYNAIQTPALKSYFRKLLSLEKVESSSESSRTDSIALFDKIIRDLQRYIRLNEEVESKPFGYIGQLSGSHIAQLVTKESNCIETLLVIAPYLSDVQMEELNKVISLEDKAKFLRRMHLQAESGTIEDMSSEHRALKAELDIKLRAIFDKFKDEAVVDVLDPSAVELLFLDSDTDCVNVIKKLAQQYGTVPTAFEKYLISFEDFLRLDIGIGKKVFQRISNEVLSKALAKHNMDKKLTKMLGDMRSQLIDSYKMQDVKVNTAEIEQAQNEILKTYRALV